MPRKTNFTTVDNHGNENHYYRTTATVGKNADGKPIRKQFYGSSKKEAEQKRDEYMAGLRQGLSVDYDKATFGIAFKHWLEHVQRPAIALSTYAKYESLHRLHIATGGLVGMRLIERLRRRTFRAITTPCWTRRPLRTYIMCISS